MSLKAKGIQSVSQILNDLTNGLTRTSKDTHYNPEKGSIQDKYNLTGVELKVLFSHHQLKGRKVKKESVVLDIEDDITVEPTIEMEANQEETTPVVETQTEETTEFKGF